MEKEVRLIDANKLPYYAVMGGNLVVYKDDIENAPTVEAEIVVLATWKEGKNGYYCSNCRGKPGAMPGGRLGAFLTKRCPHCAARMDQKTK